MNWEFIVNSLQKKMTQQEIANQSGYSQAFISLLSKGKRKDVSYEKGNKLIALCVVHGVETHINKKTSVGQN